MNRLREGGIADASAKICRPAKVADDDVLVADGDDQEGRRGDAVEGGLPHGDDLAGHDGDDGPGRGECRVGVGGQRGDLCGQVGPGRMADQGEPPGIGPDVVRPDAQDPQRVVDRGHRVGQEVLRHRADVVLIPGEDHHMAVADQVVDPGPVEPGIDGEPAVEEDHDRGRIRPGPVRLEEPVRPGPLADLVAPDAAMRRLGLVAMRPVPARRALGSARLAGFESAAGRPCGARAGNSARARAAGTQPITRRALPHARLLVPSASHGRASPPASCFGTSRLPSERMVQFAEASHLVKIVRRQARIGGSRRWEIRTDAIWFRSAAGLLGCPGGADHFDSNMRSEFVPGSI